jgi:UDP-glucose 4-epimerase
VSRDGVLLLGGTGFIGSALAARLLREGVPVRVVSRVNLQHLPQWLTGCSTVIHLASATTPGSSSALPALEQANLDLTRHLVHCLQAHPEIHLIYFSSGGTVYGNPVQLPVDEDAPLAPLSPYGVAKVTQETMCQELRTRGKYAVTILRPSNAYGPGQTVTSGFGLVRTLLEHARLGTPMGIWGDGNNVRDFIYIDDVVDAALSLIRRPQDSGVYNLGNGMGHSINQVKQLVEQVTGLRIHTEHRPARGVDVRAGVLDSAKLSHRLGWLPGVELAQGVERTWAFSH